LPDTDSSRRGCWSSVYTRWLDRISTGLSYALTAMFSDWTVSSDFMRRRRKAVVVRSHNRLFLMVVQPLSRGPVPTQSGFLHTIESTAINPCVDAPLLRQLDVDDLLHTSALVQRASSRKKCGTNAQPRFALLFVRGTLSLSLTAIACLHDNNVMSRTRPTRQRRVGSQFVAPADCPI
jgi:hypothetical protein